MTIEEPSIPLQDFPPEDTPDILSDNPTAPASESEPQLNVKSQSLSNLVNTLIIFQKRFSKKTRIENKKIILSLPLFLEHQHHQIHHFNDVEDVLEMECCTKNMEQSLSHIKFTKNITNQFNSLYSSLTEKRYELTYQKIFANLDETLAIFSDDFMSRRLRNSIHAMLHNIKDRTSIIDIFFFGKYPLAEKYHHRKFSKDVYSNPGKEHFQADVEAYLQEINKKIEELKKTSSCLSQIIIFPKKQVRAIARIEAIASVLSRPIPMMEKLKLATNQPLAPIQEKTSRAFTAQHAFRLPIYIGDIPETESLRDLLTELPYTDRD
jgi:hypothetical protein